MKWIPKTGTLFLFLFCKTESLLLLQQFYHYWVLSDIKSMNTKKKKNLLCSFLALIDINAKVYTGHPHTLTGTQMKKSIKLAPSCINACCWINEQELYNTSVKAVSVASHTDITINLLHSSITLKFMFRQWTKGTETVREHRAIKC